MPPDKNATKFKVGQFFFDEHHRVVLPKDPPIYYLLLSRDKEEIFDYAWAWRSIRFLHLSGGEFKGGHELYLFEEDIEKKKLIGSILDLI